MSQKRKVATISIAVVSTLIAALLSIIPSIATAYLPSPIETWAKEHIILFWVATGVLILLTIILAGIAAYMQFVDTGSTSHPNTELNDIINKVNKAEYIANSDSLLTGYNDRFQKLNDWKDHAVYLYKTYNNYKKLKGKISKNSTNKTVDLISKLVKYTKRSFIFLNRKSDCNYSGGYHTRMELRDEKMAPNLGDIITSRAIVSARLW